MIVNKTNVSVQKTNFLDMTISIYRGKFYIKLYDKRNDYDFDVISFPYLDGNIPKGQSYGIFISQLIRYARINTSFSNFISDCKNYLITTDSAIIIIKLCAVLSLSYLIGRTLVPLALLKQSHKLPASLRILGAEISVSTIFESD